MSMGRFAVQQHFSSLVSLKATQFPFVVHNLKALSSSELSMIDERPMVGELSNVVAYYD